MQQVGRLHTSFRFRSWLLPLPPFPCCDCSVHPKLLADGGLACQRGACHMQLRGRGPWSSAAAAQQGCAFPWHMCRGISNDVLRFFLYVTGGDTDEHQEGRSHHENHQEQEQDIRSDRQRSISSNRATGEDPDMAQPIQRARKALRDAVGNGEAQRIGGSYRSDTAEADMEEGLGRPPSSRSVHCQHVAEMW